MTAISLLLFLLLSAQTRQQSNIYAPAPQDRLIDPSHAVYYPPAPRLVADPKPGTGIQRTMHLLANSSAQHRNRVFILFYGQSITQQPWWHLVADDLRRRFPFADLKIENRAIGGFASNLLIKSSDYDLYPADPDLVIFQDYGGEPDFETIIRRIRSRTKAEVAIQTDHVLDNKDEPWEHHHNRVWLPRIAKKYRCGLINVTQAWQQALSTQHLQPSDFLADAPHLNERGMFLMAGIVSQYLVPEPGFDDPSHLVTTLPLSTASSVSLDIPFDGNTVRAVASAASPRKLSFFVDGFPPSHFQLQQMTRPNANPSLDWPWETGAVLSIGHKVSWVTEDWIIHINKIDAAGTEYFDITGSITGKDGQGDTAHRFVSNSGRVTIDPQNWFLKGVRHQLLLPVNSTVRWSTYLASQDSWQPAMPGQSIIIAQGLPNTHHRLRIEGDTSAIAAVQIEKPPFRETRPLLVLVFLLGISITAILLSLVYHNRRRMLPISTRSSKSKAK